ncbi:SH3 domain-binding glutamic acid-rich-like protein isoform X2 [Takifugu rubripes]|uniref:SH3 domain-binding glutamic acid-rich-like protein isoform X2 n=1 Tax=Takifugu rubripes TaxID=31033 RepID=UPI0005D14F83|nr:SH3 domain-binding glutamic acid-rich-like protein isoform X2 [Takifugu rubripes]|eukprot:XP_011608724.1 PREDICTED: SH3 domain-binding glutamic acid-rich-like protein isoform X2 [Takifugu rubripes]
MCVGETVQKTEQEQREKKERDCRKRVTLKGNTLPSRIIPPIYLSVPHKGCSVWGCRCDCSPWAPIRRLFHIIIPQNYEAFFDAREDNAVYAFLGLTAPPGSKEAEALLKKSQQ